MANALENAAGDWLDQVNSPQRVLSRVHQDPNSGEERFITAKEDAPLLRLMSESSQFLTFPVAGRDRSAQIEEVVPVDRYPKDRYRIVSVLRSKLLLLLRSNSGNVTPEQVGREALYAMNLLSNSSPLQELKWEGNPAPYHCLSVGAFPDGHCSAFELIACKTGGEDIRRTISSVTPEEGEASWRDAGSTFPPGTGEMTNPDAAFTRDDAERFEWSGGVLQPRLWLPAGGVSMEDAPRTFPVFGATRFISLISDGEVRAKLEWILSHRNAGKRNKTIAVDGLRSVDVSPS